MLALLFSGESPDLAYEEARRIGERKGYRVERLEERLGVAEGDPEFFKRLALTKLILEVEGIGKGGVPEIDAEGSIFVRLFPAGGENRMAWEKRVADSLPNKARVPPDTWIYGFLGKEHIVLGKRVWETDRRYLKERDVQRRPFRHPASLNALEARILVNLAQVMPRDRFLDPCCGAGGILIEAGLLGARVFGCDMDGKMVEGCRKNIQYYGIDGEVWVCDAREIKGHYDALATDLPYGKASKVLGNPREIYRNIKELADRVVVMHRENLGEGKVFSWRGFRYIHVVR